MNGKLKSSSTLDISGVDFATYRRWIEFQMTPDMKWKNIDIDHVRHVSSFEVSEDEQVKETFDWKNTQPLLEEVHQQKGLFSIC